MKSLITIFKEHKNNLYLIARLSMYELRTTYRSSRLGSVWVIFNPLIQIFLYWIVFGLGIRGGASVDGVPFFIWLICGLIPWFYTGASITQGSNSIYSRLATVSKMNFPLSIIPTLTIIQQLYTHLILLVILIVTVASAHGLKFLSILGLGYYMVSLTVILIALAFVTSALSTLVRDVQMIVQAVTRMLMFLTPIMWRVSEHTPSILIKVMDLNPFYYIIKGYRSALLWGDLSGIQSIETTIFWCTVTVLLLLGSVLHVRFRKFFVDYI